MGELCMKKYRDKSPEEVMKMVTAEIVKRAVYFSKKKKRDIFIKKTSGGKGINVLELNPAVDNGRKKLEEFLEPVKWFYTITGLGAPEEKNSVNWRKLNLPVWRRILLIFQVSISFILKGNAFKNKWYRWMGVHIGKNTEIMQLAWLDHFRPELIFIGDYTLLGAYTRVTVHLYEGCGKFRYGLSQVGSHCTLGAGTGLGFIKIEDHVRTLPGTALTPYKLKIRRGSIVGWNPPAVKFQKTPPME